MLNVFKSLVAAIIPFDNSTNDFDSDNVQEAIEEIGASASPGFNYGRSGNVSSNTWLLIVGTVPSNKAGITIALSNATISKVYIANEDINTFNIELYSHDGNEVNLTLLDTVSIVSARSATFTLNTAITTGKQLAVKLSTGSAKNLSVGVQLKGGV